jgi:hypothetical protein
VLSALSPVEISGTEHNSVYGHVLAKLGLVAHQVKGPATAVCHSIAVPKGYFLSTPKVEPRWSMASS